MHESHLARAFLNAALAQLDDAGAERILMVRGWVAETESLSPESLTLHFSRAAVGTRAAEARLEVRVTHVRARCSKCHSEYFPEHHLILCPECGSTEGDLLGPTGFGVDELEVGPA